MSDAAEDFGKPVPPHPADGGDGGTPGEQRLEQVSHLRPIGDKGSGHGKPSSWLLIGVVVTAFVVGGVAIILHIWPMLWVCVAIVVLAVPAGKALRIMDDTVSWHDAAAPDAGGDAGSTGTAAPASGEAGDHAEKAGQGSTR